MSAYVPMRSMFLCALCAYVPYVPMCSLCAYVFHKPKYENNKRNRRPCKVRLNTPTRAAAQQVASRPSEPCHGRYTSVNNVPIEISRYFRNDDLAVDKDVENTVDPFFVKLCKRPRETE